MQSSLNLEIPPHFQEVKIADIPEDIKTHIENIKKHRKGLFLWGECGTGKTHMMYALLKLFRYQMKFHARMYTTSELLELLKEDFKYEDRKNFKEILAFDGLLMLDDMGSERMTDWVAQTFFQLINDRYLKNLPVVITSNLNLAEVSDKIGDRVASRISEMCKIVKLEGGDKRINS